MRGNVLGTGLLALALLVFTTVKTSGGDLMVQLGPQKFVEAQPVRPAVGDNVMVRDSMVKAYDHAVQLAAVVIDKGDTLRLRDAETGRPLWQGAERDPGAAGPPGERDGRSEHRAR